MSLAASCELEFAINCETVKGQRTQALNDRIEWQSQRKVNSNQVEWAHIIRIQTDSLPQSGNRYKTTHPIWIDSTKFPKEYEHMWKKVEVNAKWFHWEANDIVSIYFVSVVVKPDKVLSLKSNGNGKSDKSAPPWIIGRRDKKFRQTRVTLNLDVLHIFGIFLYFPDIYLCRWWTIMPIIPDLDSWTRDVPQNRSKYSQAHVLVTDPDWQYFSWSTQNDR
jgi:hypothetical protein